MAGVKVCRCLARGRTYVKNSKTVGVIDNQHVIQIGGWEGENFLGFVDEIFIARKAFSQTDIQEIMEGWESAQAEIQGANWLWFGTILRDFDNVQSVICVPKR